MKRLILSLSLIALMPLAASAEPAEQPLGASTRAWIELQASGQQASGAARPVPGEIADLTYQRYVESYKHPIPESFKRQSSGSSSGSSGSSSGSSSSGNSDER